MKRLTIATDDRQYGVKLQAEPNSEILGKRLKADFKRVAPAVKALTDEQLLQFQEDGMISVLGHELDNNHISNKVERTHTIAS